MFGGVKILYCSILRQMALPAWQHTFRWGFTAETPRTSDDVKVPPMHEMTQEKALCVSA